MKVMLIRTNKLLANFSSKKKTFHSENGFRIIKVDKFKIKFKINGNDERLRN